MLQLLDTPHPPDRAEWQVTSNHMGLLNILEQVKGVRRMQLMFGRIISADFILPPKVSSCTPVTTAGLLLLALVGLACSEVLLCRPLEVG
jgi:hypothetical protein